MSAADGRVAGTVKISVDVEGTDTAAAMPMSDVPNVLELIRCRVSMIRQALDDMDVCPDATLLLRRDVEDELQTLINRLTGDATTDNDE